MPLTEYQQAFLRNCSHRWNIKTGATRSGKTYLDCAVTIPKRICAARDEGLLVMLGNTLGTLERNVLEPMRALWGAELVGVVRTSAAGNVVQLFGRKVYVLGADNKKHIARIQGAAFEYAYGDEITTWDEGVFQMLKSRLSCPHSHFDGTCNPDNPQHWFKRFLDSDADIYCQAYTIDDNPTLPPEFVAQLKKEYAGTVYYNRFILGQWAAAGGIIYRPFAEHRRRRQALPLARRQALQAVAGAHRGGLRRQRFTARLCGNGHFAVLFRRRGAGIPAGGPPQPGCRLPGQPIAHLLPGRVRTVRRDPLHVL